MNPKPYTLTPAAPLLLGGGLSQLPYQQRMGGSTTAKQIKGVQLGPSRVFGWAEFFSWRVLRNRGSRVQFRDSRGIIGVSFRTIGVCFENPPLLACNRCFATGTRAFTFPIPMDFDMQAVWRKTWEAVCRSSPVERPSPIIIY